MNSLYSHDTKKEIVKAYLNGLATVEQLSKQYSCSLEVRKTNKVESNES